MVAPALFTSYHSLIACQRLGGNTFTSHRHDPGSSPVSLCATHKDSSGFPLGLENLKKWEGIFQSGKITQNTGKLWNFRQILYVIL